MEFSMAQSWSIIILCYNEEGSIKKTVLDVQSTLLKMGVEDFEIIVVNDGSTDSSLEVLSALEKEVSQLVVKKHPKNLGIGQTLRTGFLSAVKENVMAMCGDGQFNLEDLLPHANVSMDTMISFYRVDKGPYTLFRHFVSNVNKWLNKYVLGADITDVNWVKIYKRDNLKSIDLELKSSLLETEIVTKLLKKSIKLKEYETIYLPRLYGEPKGASFKVLSMAIMELFKLIYILRVRSLFLRK